MSFFQQNKAPFCIYCYEFYSVLRDEVREKHVMIGETSGNLAASSSLPCPAEDLQKSKSFAAIPGRPVNRQVLWFFATNTAVEL